MYLIFMIFAWVVDKPGKIYPSDEKWRLHRDISGTGDDDDQDSDTGAVDLYLYHCSSHQPSHPT